MELEKEFTKTAFLDPKFEYDPLYKYQSFYIKIGDKLDRCGVVKLSCDLLPKKIYEQKYEKINLKCYSNNVGFFTLDNISYHKGKNFVNVYEPLIYYKSKTDEKYSIMKYDNVYEASELDEVTVIYSVLIKSGNPYNVFNIYVNQDGKTKYVIENVSSYDYLHETENEIIYIKQDGGKKAPFSFYSFNYITGETIYLGSQNDIHMYAEGLQTCRIADKVKKSKREILDEKNVYFYFAADSSNGFNVFLEYLKKADGLEKINNVFSKDVTENFVAWFNKKRIAEIQFACYILIKFNIPGLKILGVEVKKIAKTINFGSGVYKFHMKNELSREYDSISKIIGLLKSKYSKTDIELVKFLCEEYGKFSVDFIETKMDPYRKKATIQHPLGLEKSILEGFNKDIKLIFQESLLNDETKVRWRSEFQLFKLVNTHFAETIYQYRPLWLGRQSLDIFIVSENIAIEYQGEQHYKAVELFGGKEALKESKERDTRKRLLCKENGVKLIEWKYDYPINIFNFAEILQQEGIILDVETSKID